MSMIKILQLPEEQRSVAELETVAIASNETIQSVVRSVETAHTQSRLTFDPVNGGPATIEWDDGTRHVLGLHYDGTMKHFASKQEEADANGKKKPTTRGASGAKRPGACGIVDRQAIVEIERLWAREPVLALAFEFEWKTLTSKGYKITSGTNDLVSMFVDSLNHDMLGNVLCDAMRQQFKFGFTVLAMPASPLRWATYDIMPFDEWLEGMSSSSSSSSVTKRDGPRRQQRRRPMTSHARTTLRPGLIHNANQLPCKVIDPSQGIITVVCKDGELQYEFEYYGPPGQDDASRDSFARAHRFLVCPAIRADVRPSATGELQSAVARIMAHHKRTVVPMEYFRTSVTATRAQRIEFCNTDIPLRDENKMSPEDRTRLDQLRQRPGSLGQTDIDFIVDSMFRNSVQPLDEHAQELFLSSHLTSQQIQEVKSHLRSEMYGQGARRLDRVLRAHPLLIERGAGSATSSLLVDGSRDLSKTTYDDWDSEMIRNYNRPDYPRDDLMRDRVRFQGAVKHAAYVQPEFNLAEREAIMADYRTFIAQALMVPESVLYAKSSSSSGKSGSGGQRSASSMSETDGEISQHLSQMAVENMRRDCVGLFDFIYRECFGLIYTAGVDNVIDALNVMGMDALTNLTQRQLYLLLNSEKYEHAIEPTSEMTLAERFSEMARGHMLVKDDVTSQWILEHYHSILKVLFIIESANNVASTHVRIQFGWSPTIATVQKSSTSS